MRFPTEAWQPASCGAQTIGTRADGEGEEKGGSGDKKKTKGTRLTIVSARHEECDSDCDRASVASADVPLGAFREATEQTTPEGQRSGESVSGRSPSFPPLCTDSALGWRKLYGRLDGEARPMAAIRRLGSRVNRHAGKQPPPNPPKLGQLEQKKKDRDSAKIRGFIISLSFVCLAACATGTQISMCEKNIASFTSHPIPSTPLRPSHTHQCS